MSMQVILAQALLGLNVGVFYAMLSLGLAVIFGLLNIINFAHGAMYMLGAFIALIGYSLLEQWFGISLQIGFWASLLVAPVIVGILGVTIERFMLKRLYDLDHIYGLLLTFGITLILQGLFANYFNVSGTPYPGQPESLSGVVNLGFMYFPTYRLFAIIFSLVVCFATWYVIEHTKLGSRLRAGVENPDLTQAFGLNVPLMITLTLSLIHI